MHSLVPRPPVFDHLQNTVSDQKLVVKKAWEQGDAGSYNGLKIMLHVGILG